MSKLGGLLLVWAICEGVVSLEEQNDFVQPLDFEPIFASGASLAANPLAAAVLKVDKNQYPQLFDTIVSSSIDSLQTRLAPRELAFSAESFGFNPIASQSFLPPGSSAKLVARPKQQHVQHQAIPVGQQLGPLRYDIRTVHDANYKVYKPEEEQQEEDILAALKKNPAVSAYFKPTETNVEVAHPLKYRTEEFIENADVEQQNYKPNAYLTGHPRVRRYTSGRQRANLKKSHEEDDDPYNYKVDYIYKPKAFDGESYSAYKEAKDPNKNYEYPYGGYDSGYDHKEYDRIKELSEKQAADIKQNPGNCKEVKKDGMTCTTCKDPKTGGNFESCSYVAEPKNNKYAYSKERKFDSNDEPEESEAPQEADAPNKSEKYEQVKDDSSEQKYSKLSAAEPLKDDESSEKYKGYYRHSTKPKTSEALQDADEKQSSEEDRDGSGGKAYDYKKAIPGFYTDNEPKKDVEHVLAEFKKKDRSSCKKVQKNGMTCYQCIDKNGLKNEECMFVSESAPKRSHLAYQELKEFTSKPTALENNNKGAESKIVTTSAPPAKKSASYVVDTNTYGKKLKRKKATQTIVAAAAATPAVNVVKPVSSATIVQKTKRSVESKAEENSKIIDETNLAPPEEFAGSDSKGAFWAETIPRYSPTLGVTLPQYMLSRSDHEVSFDETVANA
ncbi:unnamed protein product [Arctia plantaginis]|uniref:Uncharacterized protein n=1 Tax=Arctia plantaginis TaxID=874455 RepID=A0A8S1ABR3_ARCPL|nr:unnamed protein product [Arctia plantaginis]